MGTLFVNDDDGHDSNIWSIKINPIYGHVTIDPLFGVWTYVPYKYWYGIDTFTIE